MVAPTTLAYLAIGLALLALGAELLLRAGARLATHIGLSPWIVGLVIAAVGSNAPDLAVGIVAVQQNSSDLAIGNVIGSNIANILLLLGLASLMLPQNLSRHLVHQGLALLWGAGLLTLLLAQDGLLDRWDGALLLAALLPCTAILLCSKHKQQPLTTTLMASADGSWQPVKRPQAWLLNVLLSLAGLALLYVGAWLSVDASRELALELGLSELTIGLSVLAIGTALPEMAIAFLATWRGQHSRVASNAIGCSILNLLLVLGCAALIAPDEGLSVSPNVIAFDLPVMLATFAACLPVFLSGYRISRWQGLLFVAYYLAYLLYLALFATGLPSFGLFRHTMAWLILPLTALLLTILSWRTWRRHQSNPAPPLQHKNPDITDHRRR